MVNPKWFCMVNYTHLYKNQTLYKGVLIYYQVGFGGEFRPAFWKKIQPTHKIKKKKKNSQANYIW